MVTKDILESFFEAENKRDWAIYKQFLHTEIIWQLFDKKVRTIGGVENYMETMKKAYENTDIQFSCQNMQISKDGNRIAAYLINDSGICSLDIFDFKDNLIYREYEFILD